MAMRNNLRAFLVMVAIIATPAAHAGKIFPVDFGIETSTGSMLMPGSALGAVVLRCASCEPHSYQLTNQTTYSIGEKPVTFAALGAFLKTAGIRSATLFVNPDGKTVTRVSVSAGN